VSSSYIPRALRERITEEARGRCGYCLSQEAVIGMAMDIDHIIPKADGGPTIESNLWLACEACNALKGSRTDGLDGETGALIRLFNPRTDAWREHFAWAPGGAIVVGLTPIGRVTVAVLDLNRERLVGARRMWVAAGWHPPRD
jgi:hypothetical protein